ncbi:MAG: DNA-3-methyladenine glycosylase I [candidate division Zixibacteria bacterium]|nr:DNA-3-methyladenine glycosylase I [candidate division Zixibacteria bacterium]
MIKKCDWCVGNPLMEHYHDTEWGVPLHDDRKLFEFLVLDAMQAGLSWQTVLNKRENFRKAFDNYDIEKIARYRQPKIEKLLQDKGIIRNKMKVNSAVTNAKAFLKVVDEFGSFDEFIWGFVDGKPIVNKWKTMREIPAESEESHRMSKELKRRGFSFAGPTICYAFMQAAGMVNDHIVSCFRYREII